MDLSKVSARHALGRASVDGEQHGESAVVRPKRILLGAAVKTQAPQNLQSSVFRLQEVQAPNLRWLDALRLRSDATNGVLRRVRRKNGGRSRIRTYDFHRVKMALYR